MSMQKLVDESNGAFLTAAAHVAAAPAPSAPAWPPEPVGDTGAICTDFSDFTWMVDVSVYEANVDFKKLWDMGARIFAIRATNPAYLVEGSEKVSVDTTYFQRLYEIRKVCPDAMIIGYNVLVPSYDLLDPANQHENIDSMDLAYHRPQDRPDVIAIDFELNYFWRGAAKITVPAPNLSTVALRMLHASWDVYKRPGLLYTRRSFLDEATGSSAGQFFESPLDFDNNSYKKQYGQEHWPVWWAWYVNAFTGKVSVTNFDDLKPKIPFVTQENRKLLECGSDTGWFAWQMGSTFYCDAITGTDGQPHAFDLSIVHMNYDQARAYMGLPPLSGSSGGTGGDNGGSTGGGNGGGAGTGDVQGEIDALTVRVGTLENKVKGAATALS